MVKNEDLSKAHFRKSMSLYHLKDFENSLLEIEKSLALTPSDPLLLKQSALIKKEISERSIKEKKMYQKMFG